MIKARKRIWILEKDPLDARGLMALLSDDHEVRILEPATLLEELSEQKPSAIIISEDALQEWVNREGWSVQGNELAEWLRQRCGPGCGVLILGRGLLNKRQVGETWVMETDRRPLGKTVRRGLQDLAGGGD